MEEQRLRKRLSALLGDAVPRARRPNGRKAVVAACVLGVLSLGLMASQTSSVDLKCVSGLCLETHGMQMPFREALGLVNACIAVREVDITKTNAVDWTRYNTDRAGYTRAWMGYKRLLDSRLPFDRGAQVSTHMGMVCAEFMLNFRDPARWS